LPSLLPDSSSPAPASRNTVITAAPKQNSRQESIDRNSNTGKPEASPSAFEYGGEAESKEDVISSIPPFQPLFTLIEDTRTGNHHHPAVHYVFTDDDGDMITDAAQRIEELRAAYEASLRSTSAGDKKRSRSRSASHTPNDPARGKARAEGSLRSKSRSRSRSLGTGRTSARPRERFIVVTLGPDGRSIAAAHSMTSDWQVLEAEVSTAPMLDGVEGGREEEGGGGNGGAGDHADEEGEDEAGEIDAREGRSKQKLQPLMLKIEGTEEITGAGNGERGDGGGKGVGGIEEEVERFRLRMNELKKVVVRAERDVPLSLQPMELDNQD
jgi:hypothetical protein